MRRFQVPQFIEVEDKIFGPLTLKQFIYLAGGGGLSVVIFLFVEAFILKVLLILPVAGLAVALAFYKVNNRPFIEVLESAFQYFLSTRLYIWKKKEKPVKKGEEEEPADKPIMSVPRLSKSKLKDLTWSLDVQEAQNPATRGEESNVT